MESVTVSFVLHRSFAKMLLSQTAKVPLLRCVVAMVRSRGHGSGDCNVYASSRSHQGLPGGSRCQPLTRCFGLFRAVWSQQTLSARFLCHVRCGFEVCGVASVNGEFVLGTRSAAPASVTSMRNRRTPHQIPDASSGRCFCSPSMFGCSRMEEVSLAKVRNCKQDMLTSSSYRHKTKERTHFVIAVHTVLC